MKLLSHVKGRLKKNPFLYSVNAALKSRITSKRRQKLYDYYSEKADAEGIKYSEEYVIECFQEKLKKRGISPFAKSNRTIRIFWVGTRKEQDYSGFLQSLESFGEVIPFYNEKGSYGLAWKDLSDTRYSVPEVVTSNSRCLLNEVKKHHDESPINLLIGQMWAHVLDVETLIAIQNLGIVTVNISMDDRLPDVWGTYAGRRMGSIGLAKGLDLVLTTSRDTCLWYLLENSLSLYWPLASSPEIFKPANTKKYDVVFVAGNYGQRGKLVEHLVSAGISVETFGPGWKNGYINFDKIAEVFGEAKIILGSGYVGYNQDIITIKLRDFDATMSGALYITTYYQDLEDLFVLEKEIVTYKTPEECVKKIKTYLDNPLKAEAIATAGRLRSQNDHTWVKRLEVLFKLL